MTALDDSRHALETAIVAAHDLGLPVVAADRVRQTIVDRVGFPGDLYVLALAGGTGVGKSSLLNALAAEEVSTAGVHRPTTKHAVAWVPEARAEEVGPLLDWLGGAELRIHAATGHEPRSDEAPRSGEARPCRAPSHAPGGRPAGDRPSDGDALASVAILDLPDLDSIEPGHAARVDAVLPRVDAVLWVSDPEKYADSVLHDRYLRHWLPRLDRQAFALNKVDRISDADVQALGQDVRRRLAEAGATGLPVLLMSAKRDIGALRSWLADGVAAKDIVTTRLHTAARASVLELVAAAGLDPDVEPEPLITTSARDAATESTSRAILAVVDLDGLRDQAIAATRAAARSRGGGPLGVVRALVERGSGTRERDADPEGYLLRWRERGTLAPATQQVRDLVTGSLPVLPVAARAGFAALADTVAIGERLGQATDRAVAGPAGRFQVPTSSWWSIVGAAQLLATAAIVVGVVWLVALLAIGGSVPTGTFDVPLLGPVPTPAVLVIGGLVASFLLGRVLSAHAAWLGRRWADRLAARVTSEVKAAIAVTALEPVRTWEDARRRLWLACRTSVRRDPPATPLDGSDAASRPETPRRSAAATGAGARV